MESVPQRRLPMASPLLLLVHGRAGGLIPPELTALAQQLELERRAPVALHALSAGAAPSLLPQGSGGQSLILVPLLLLPGAHVRQDIPRWLDALRAQWRHAPVRRLPFMGAWPSWQRALAEEVEALSRAAGVGACAGGRSDAANPLLLHHPIDSPLGSRYLAVLERRCRVRCRAARFEDPWPPEPPLEKGPWLPLALAANRLTEALQAQGLGSAARPLLERQTLRRCLWERLRRLP